jgi:hypothetical protein
MPVQETQDAAAELRAAELPLGCVLVNMVREPVLAPAELELAAARRLDRAEVVAGLEAAGLPGRGSGGVREALLDRLADGLLGEGADHALRVRLEREQRDELAALGRPIAELPAMPGGVDLGALYELSDVLLEQGVVQ